MKTEHQKVGTVDVLTPVGALVDEDAEQFSRVLLERLKSSNPRVVLSLAEVPYMDSAALEGLLKATDELADRAMSLKLANLPPTCREILEFFFDPHSGRNRNDPAVKTPYTSDTNLESKECQDQPTCIHWKNLGPRSCGCSWSGPVILLCTG